MSDRTCKTCKWWVNPLPFEGIQTHGWGTCELTKESYKERSRSQVWDEFGEESLMTAPDFGCNQWEGNES